MKALLTVGQGVFNWTWKTSLQAAVLVVLVLAVERLLGRRLTPRLRYAFSLLVLLRLLLPVAPSSSLSLQNMFNRITLPAPPAVITTAIAFTEPTYSTSARRKVSSASLTTVLGASWFSGVLALTCFAGWRYCTWRSLVRSAKRISDITLLQALDAAREEMGVSRPVELLSLSQVSSPAVFGFWRTRLLLPMDMLQALSAEEWQMIFMHEMAHVRGNDAFLNILLMGMQFLHWFNPLVWVGLHRLRADRELVCDAMVLKRVGLQNRSGYAQVLLKLAERFSLGARLLPAVVPIVSTHREIKIRILAAKHYREPRWMLRFATITLMFALGCLTFTRAKEPGSESRTPALREPDQVKLRMIVLMKLLNPDVSYARKLSEQLISQLKRGANFAELAHIYSQMPETRKAVWYNRSVLRSELEELAFALRPGEWSQVIETSDACYILMVDDVRYTGPNSRTATRANSNGRGPMDYVSEIVIRYLGPPVVKESDVRAKIRAQVGKPVSQVVLDDDVRKLYATGLFYNIRATTTTNANRGGIELVYTVQCNPRLAEVKFSGNSTLSDAELREAISSKVGSAFNERKLFADCDTIQKMYENAGHRVAGVTYSFEIDTESGKATAIFTITKQQ